MRLIGIFSIGLLLTYVLQVQVSPYGQPVEFWPSVAASTSIYVLGLVGILLHSFLAMMSEVLFKKVLVADGFSGSVTHAYDVKYLPVQGRSPEEDLPLLRKKDMHDSAGRGNDPKASDDPTEVECPEVYRFPTSRSANMKIYSVLSVEEVDIINRFVWWDFLARTVRAKERVGWIL